ELDRHRLVAHDRARDDDVAGSLEGLDEIGSAAIGALVARVADRDHGEAQRERGFTAVLFEAHRSLLVWGARRWKRSSEIMRMGSYSPTHSVESSRELDDARG